MTLTVPKSDFDRYSELYPDYEILIAENRVREPYIKRNKQHVRWPKVLLPLKLLAKPGDRGAGDIIARVTGPVGGEAFKHWYKLTFGKDCKCPLRQESLNMRWPL